MMGRVTNIASQTNVVASYTWGEGIDKLLAVTIGGATYYPLTDVQGTVWGYADSQNNGVARWTYDAWGNVLSEEVAPTASALSRVQGREWSAATGLVNFRMRWYDAETGRWLSKDPIGLSGGLNLYAFCEGDPLNGRDPVGLKDDDGNDDGKNGENGDLPIDYVKGLTESAAATLPEGFLDVAGQTAGGTSIGVAKTVADGIRVAPKLFRVVGAARESKNIVEMLADDPQGVIDSAQAGGQMEQSEKIFMVCWAPFPG